MIRLTTLIEDYWKRQGEFSQINYNSENPFLIDPSNIPRFFLDHFTYQSLAGAGRNALAIQLCQGDVLKIAQYPVFPQRGFDVPTYRYGIAGNISYNVQPHVAIAKEWEDVYLFEEIIKKQGYCFIDPGPQQIGFYRGRLVLVDYESVEMDDGTFNIDAL